MTTRQDLVSLAKAHAVPGTPEILVAIDEAHIQLNRATWQLAVRSRSAESEKDRGTYQSVGSFMDEACAYEVAAGKLNTLFLTLATLLQNAGVPVEY